MTDNFGVYSLYYDLLYDDKDYRAEVRYLRALFSEHLPRPVQSLLEIGCGTGIHATALAVDGTQVRGVDLSTTMLERAAGRAADAGLAPPHLSFEQGDARGYRAGRTFDAVISLFHVLSYQTTDNDLLAMMQTAAVHLEPGGLFVFDFWYGPAVLSQRPQVRVKRLSNDRVSVTRIAEPVLHDALNLVDVGYTMFVKPAGDAPIEEIRETHRMRYLFMTEIDALLAAQGFERLRAEEWLTRHPVSVDSWGVCVVARRR